MKITIEFKSVPELKRELKLLHEQLERDTTSIETMKKKKIVKLEDVRLSDRIRIPLEKAGVYSLNALCEMKEQKLLGIPNIGKGARQAINKVLRENDFRVIAY